MNDRKRSPSELPAKNQQIAITLASGKTYAIVSEGQMDFIMECAAEKFMADAVNEKRQLTDTELRAKLIEYLEKDSEFATLDYVLSKMSPQERDDWKQKYRFSGIWRSKKS